MFTRRLNVLGISNHVPAMTGYPAIPIERATLIAKSIVALRHTFTTRSSLLFSNGDLELKIQRLSYRGVPKVQPNDKVFADLNVDEIMTWLCESQAVQIPIFLHFS